MKQHLSYALPAPEAWITNLELFNEITAELANEFLDKAWNEEIIDEIHEYGLKAENGEECYTKPAYKYFEQEKREISESWRKELPSRYRRGIMEKVGRTLRSQKERKDCFYDVLPIFLEYYDLNVKDVKKRKWKAFKKIRQDLIANGKYHDYNLLKQTVYQIANYYEANGRLPEKYVEAVKPCFKSGTFPFDVDDGKIGFGKISKGDKGRLFQMCYRVKDCELKLHLRVKLPVKREDGTIEWRWFEEDIEAYPKFKEMLMKYGIKKPILVRRQLKSGFHQYQFIFPFEVEADAEVEVKGEYGAGQEYILSIDLNERKLIAAVVMDNYGNQLTPPIFIKTLPEIREKILRIREEVKNISSKIGKGLDFDNRLFAERRKKWAKLNSIADQLTHEVANVIVKLAQILGCKYIVFEDLRSYQPPKGRGLLSWLLSMWRRGNVITVTRYKALRRGIEVKTVNPNSTSQICPRCNARGEHVKAPDRLNEKDDSYGFFHCPECGYMADRDYVAAVNVGRKFLLELEAGEDGNKNGKGSLRLEKAKTTAYRAVVGSPADRSRRGKHGRKKSKISRRSWSWRVRRLGMFRWRKRKYRYRPRKFLGINLHLSAVSIRSRRVIKLGRMLGLVKFDEVR